MVGRHEKVNAQLWDARLQTWRPLLPFGDLDLPYSTDWAVNLGTLTLPGDHPQSASLMSIRDGAPRPVRFTINGVIWDGQITRAELKSENGQPAVWHCQVESDAKHGHRMQARDTAVSAADMTATRLQGWLGDVTRRLVASAAQRTGLPVYILVEGEGDPIEVEARTEDTVHDVLQDATVGSRMHLDVRRLLPEDSLPGEGTLFHVAGVMERQWEQAELDAGEWPHAETHARIRGVAEPHPQLLLPARSWRGEGTVDINGMVVEQRAGICWVPFETKVTEPADYFNRPDPAGVRVATETELREIQDQHPGWATHLTFWSSWTPSSPDSTRLADAVGEGLVTRLDGTTFTSVEQVHAYVGGGAMWAWRDGARWIVATNADHAAESSRRAPRNALQRQTPGLLVHLHPERDRRGVVFSSTPGGGLEAWSVAHTAGDGAMVIMGAQMDERIIAAAREGLLPPSLIGSYTPSEAQGVLPSGSQVPGTVDRVDVDAQPLAAIDGTEVTYTSAGGRVDMARAGVMFYRERYLSLPSTGGGDPVHEITRAYAEAQGTSTMSLTPGSSSSVVFGDDVRRPDGTIIPGWRPGDRVSFVDQWTRISEVIAGYRLKATNGRLVSAVPILGRKETGVLAGLGARLRQAEREALKAKLAPPRRLPEQELIAAAAQQAAEAMLVEQQEREVALQVEREEREAEAAKIARDRFTLHENSMKWMSWTRQVRNYAFSTASGSTGYVSDSIDTGYVDVRLNTQEGQGYSLIVRPGWKGQWQVVWTDQDGGGTTHAGQEDGSRLAATYDTYEVTHTIRYAEVTVWPEYSTAPREWVVQVQHTGTPVFVSSEKSFGNVTISGAPEQRADGAIIFGDPVTASHDVLVNGTLTASGTTIPAGALIRPTADEEDGMIVFTEAKGDLVWEPGAPLSGRQHLPIAARTLEQSTWTTLASWVGLAWPSARTAQISFDLKWYQYPYLRSSAYETRITRNGAVIAGPLTRYSLGSMDTQFSLSASGQTISVGDVIRFEARCSASNSLDRRIHPSSAEIRWS